ncbi:protein kinase [Streptomyces laculatispora]|uniref:non-specific serine/threonine protein kinase n=1 Tax=Streptomyces laculatispora TaxID=887464 RepID=A0ABY9HYS0_9ACTN|nr:serine/threonine-protein kinase [Streptomyces laculatispora]WLQ39088.1 protein kinase [Streptomyces laculatispora]
MRGALLAGRYRLGKPIGSGGMGTVWRATDTYRQRGVAVKMVTGLAEGMTSETAGRFHREIQVASRLHHPHIVEMHDAGEAVVDGRPVLYLVMEEIPGEPLSRVLDVRRPSLAEIARWGGEICDALAAMHGEGVVHRDLKPANVMIGPDGHVTVLDFGIARLDATGIDLTTLTRTGSVLGTVAFMSPEQAGGGGEVGAPSDLYSLGCLLYATLVGGPPFSEGPWQRILLQHLDEVPAAPGLRRSGLPPEWDTLVLELLAKQPEHRPPTALAVRERLAALPFPQAAPAEVLSRISVPPEAASVTAPGSGATLVDPDGVATASVTPDGSAPQGPAPGAAAETSDVRAADTVTHNEGSVSAVHPPTEVWSGAPEPISSNSGDVISRSLTWGQLLAFFAGVVVLLVGLVAVILIMSGRGAGQSVGTSGLIVVGGFVAFVLFGILHAVYIDVWRPRRIKRQVGRWSWSNERVEAFAAVDRAMRKGRRIEVVFEPEGGGCVTYVIFPSRFVEAGLVGWTESGEEVLFPDDQLLTVMAVQDDGGG